VGPFFTTNADITGRDIGHSRVDTPPHFDTADSGSLAGNVSRSAIARLALVRGLAVLEEEYPRSASYQERVQAHLAAKIRED